MTDARLANLLGALAGEIAGRLERAVRTHPNGTDSAAAALNVLGWYDGCSTARLASILVSHPAAVRLVDRLEAQGLAEAGRSEADRRLTTLRLTPAGRAAARAILDARACALSGLVGLLDAAERPLLEGLVATLLARLTADGLHAEHICRLCDDGACPEDTCPVHQAALPSGEAAPR